MNLFRGGMYLAEIGLDRPKTFLIVSDDGINMGLRQPIAARVSQNPRDRTIQTAVELDAGTGGLDEISYVLCHDLWTLNESDFVTCLGKLDAVELFQVEQKLKLALRLD